MLLPSSAEIPHETDELFLLQIDETFDVPDVGLVAGGLLTQGLIRENDVLLAGPDSFGEFQRVRVTSLQRNRVQCRMVRAGESATLALEVKRPQTIRKGTVLCSPSGRPVAGMLFQVRAWSVEISCQSLWVSESSSSKC